MACTVSYYVELACSSPFLPASFLERRVTRRRCLLHDGAGSRRRVLRSLAIALLAGAETIHFIAHRTCVRGAVALRGHDQQLLCVDVKLAQLDPVRAAREQASAGGVAQQNMPGDAAALTPVRAVAVAVITAADAAPPRPG